MQACQALSIPDLKEFYYSLANCLDRLLGAHRKHRPMYRNFPKQVMEMRHAELYFNALFTYMIGGAFLPDEQEHVRPSFISTTTPKVIELGTQEEFDGLFGAIVSGNVSLSLQDQEDVAWFLKAYGEEIVRLLPEQIPQKENTAILCALLFENLKNPEAIVSKYIKTTTDTLRLAVAMSGGDVSLAKPTRFTAFRRSHRRLLLSFIERHPHRLSDMLVWKERWKRLGEHLHPGEFWKAYPETLAAFNVIRKKWPTNNFNAAVEFNLYQQNVPKALSFLTAKPGALTRRLDHLLRLDPAQAGTILNAFEQVTDKVSTPVLLQARHHFAHRSESTDLRTFFPKGNVGKAFATPDTRPKIDEAACERAAAICRAALKDRFSKLPPLGACYLDESLKNYPMPFAMRSASRTLRTLTRGSRLPLPDADTLRFFVWWTNGNSRTDVDLSAVLLTENFELLEYLTYYNLRGYGGCHSGDIIDAPAGASEFIDINRAKVREIDTRYIAMTVKSFCGQPFSSLPECFAGWMTRKDANSGEIYEPRTVQDRLDLTAYTTISVPIVFDLVENQAIWCDLALTRNPTWPNNVHGNLGGLVYGLRSLAELNKPTMYDLFRLHIEARGTFVSSPDEADRVFSVEAGTPFQIETIASQYMA